MNTELDQFLDILDHGIDWDAPKGQRSSYDTAQNVNFFAAVQQHPDLYERFVDYISHALDLVEPEQKGDDNIVQLLSVLEEIEQAYQSQQLPITAPAHSMAGVLEQMEELEQFDTSDSVVALRQALERGTIQSGLGTVQRPLRTPK